MYLSVVGCDNWADWSITGPPGGDEFAKSIQNGKQKVTILAQKEGKGLWIYFVDDNGEKHAMREVAWFFAEEDDESWQLEIAAMIARPNKEAQGELETQFHECKAELQ